MHARRPLLKRESKSERALSRCRVNPTTLSSIGRWQPRLNGDPHIYLWTHLYRVTCSLAHITSTHVCVHAEHEQWTLIRRAGELLNSDEFTFRRRERERERNKRLHARIGRNCELYCISPLIRRIAGVVWKVMNRCIRISLCEFYFRTLAHWVDSAAVAYLHIPLPSVRSYGGGQ